MKHKLKEIFIVAATCGLLSASAAGATGSMGREGGGGDEIGIEFVHSAQSAFVQLPPITDTRIQKEIQDTLSSVLVIVTDQPLEVTVGSSEQDSAAMNFPSKNTVYVSRQRWNAIRSTPDREMLAAHEIYSLVGLEKTGDYHISSTLSLNFKQAPTTAQSAAESAIGNMGPKATTAERFSLLKNLFEAATQPYPMTDVPKLRHAHFEDPFGSSHGCMGVTTAGESVDFSLYAQPTLIEIKAPVPAVEGHGPLMPGTAASPGVYQPGPINYFVEEPMADFTEVPLIISPLEAAAGKAASLGLSSDGKSFIFQEGASVASRAHGYELGYRPSMVEVRTYKSMVLLKAYPPKYVKGSWLSVLDSTLNANNYFYGYCWSQK